MRKIAIFLLQFFNLFLLIWAGLFIMPSFWDIHPYAVLSGSMEPELPVGSMVYVLPVETEELQEGLVVAFSFGDQLVMHRIIAIDPDQQQLWTKGDANNSLDPESISTIQVRGKKGLVIPWVGYVAKVWQDTGGARAFLVLALLNLLFCVVGDKKKTKEKTKSLNENQNFTKTQIRKEKRKKNEKQKTNEK